MALPLLRPDDVMWKIVINDLPKLKEEVDALLVSDQS